MFNTPRQLQPSNRNLPHPLHALDTWKASKCNRPTQKGFCERSKPILIGVSTHGGQAHTCWLPGATARASDLIGVSETADGGNSCQYLLSIYSICVSMHGPTHRARLPYVLSFLTLANTYPLYISKCRFLLPPCSLLPNAHWPIPTLKNSHPISLTSPTALSFLSFLPPLELPLQFERTLTHTNQPS